MSRRFGRNQKRRLREAAAGAERAIALAQRRESDLRDFTYEVEHLLGDLRHSSLREPDLIRASATYGGRLEMIQRKRREIMLSPRMGEASFLNEAALYSRIVLHELRTTVERDFQHRYLHATVEHDDFGARYFLTDRALACANPIVFDTMIATVARDLVRKLVEATRAHQSTATPGSHFKES